MKKHLTLSALLTTLMLSTLVSQAAEVPDAPYISTSGHATIQAQPDMATLQIEVSAQAAQAGEAKKQVDQRVAAYFNFLKQQGITQEEINAANVSTQPRYDYSQKGQPKLLGYQATRQVTVSLHQLDKLNPLLDGALNAGLNEIRGITLGVANPSQYQQQARAAAIKDAIEQAQALAKGFGSTLGPVWSIDYQSQPNSPVPVYRMMAMKSVAIDTSADETYQQPKIDFKDQVNVVYQLKNGQTAGDHP